MCRFVSLITTIIVLAATSESFAQRRGVDSPSERDLARANVEIGEMKVDLRAARNAVKEVQDRAVRERLELLLSRVALNVEELEELLGNSDRRRPKRLMTDPEFAKLLDNVKDQSFDDDKLEFIETFVKGRPLTCDQASKILKTLSFDEGRIKTAIVLYPSIVNQEDFYEILKILPFESSRKKVMEAIRKK